MLIEHKSCRELPIVPEIIVVGYLGDNVPLWSFDYNPQVFKRIEDVFCEALRVGAYYPYWMGVA